ncbi:MAG: quinone-dependent dihydroorotate dehydrogenase [Chitinophagaceae bacterium]
MYYLLRSLLFCFSPEKVHYFSMHSLKILCSIGFKKLLAAMFKPKGNLEFESWNLKFPNRVGLGAGFDKNASYLRELECLGFGFVEIGTVTPLPQPGNDKPRVFRLVKDKGLINRMGFNNEGVKVVAERLKCWKEKYEVRNKKYGNSPLTTHHSRLSIGGNIGKNKITPNEDAWKDYEICFKELHPFVDYFVVNVSSPNTPGLRELQEKESLRKILTHLQTINSTQPKSKPLLLKIAPDLTKEQIDDVIELALEINLDGLVATNTTISREDLITPKTKVEAMGAGGLSGLPVKKRSTEVVKYISEKTQGKIPIMASGGIFTGEDAKEKIAAGALVVQVWTGFIYEGPAIVKNICKTLNN